MTTDEDPERPIETEHCLVNQLHAASNEQAWPTTYAGTRVSGCLRVAAPVDQRLLCTAMVIFNSTPRSMQSRQLGINIMMFA